jgi:hypothetical protein
MVIAENVTQKHEQATEHKQRTVSKHGGSLWHGNIWVHQCNRNSKWRQNYALLCNTEQPHSINTEENKDKALFCFVTIPVSFWQSKCEVQPSIRNTRDFQMIGPLGQHYMEESYKQIVKWDFGIGNKECSTKHTCFHHGVIAGSSESDNKLPGNFLTRYYELLKK